MNKKERITEMLQGMNDSYLLAIHREYIYKCNRWDDEIFETNMIDEIFSGQSPEYILCRAYYGDFDPNADYFTFNGYGNLQSVYSYELCDYIDIEDMAVYCIENNDDFDDDDIRDILDDRGGDEQ